MAKSNIHISMSAIGDLYEGKDVMLMKELESNNTKIIDFPDIVHSIMKQFDGKKVKMNIAITIDEI